MDRRMVQKLDAFFTQSAPISYKKGDIIIRSFDPIFGVFYLKKGYVEQYLLTKGGDKVTLHIFKPVSFFPMMLFLNHIPNRYNFQALTDLSLWRASPENVLAFLKREPDVLLDLTSRFAQRLNGLSLRIENLLFLGAYKRLLSLLIYLAKRFGKAYPQKEGKTPVYIGIDLPLTHGEIASWIGCERETVSRSMEALKKKRIIDYKSRIIVKDLEKLEREFAYANAR